VHIAVWKDIESPLATQRSRLGLNDGSSLCSTLYTGGGVEYPALPSSASRAARSKSTPFAFELARNARTYTSHFCPQHFLLCNFGLYQFEFEFEL
jgi:hypothetical protein